MVKEKNRKFRRMLSKYKTGNLEDLKKHQAGIKSILNQEPPEWLLTNTVIIEDGQEKEIKVTRLNKLYELLDLVFESYDIEQKNVQKIGTAIIVTVRIWAKDLDGGEIVREGSGMVDATKGLRNASSMAEALAIKNTAKKFGKIFGRDLYAKQEDEKGTATEPTKPTEEKPEELDEKSPRGRIILQARRTKTPKALEKVYKTAVELYKTGEIDPEDLQVFDEIKKKGEELGIKFE